MSGRFLLGISQPVRPDEATSRLSQYIDFALLRLFLGVEELTTTQIAQALPLAPSSISRKVTRLVDKGLVQRQRLLNDRRVVILTLTEDGMALTQDLPPARRCPDHHTKHRSVSFCANESSPARLPRWPSLPLLA